MNGSLYFADLVMILDSLKHGDYWSAVARAVATLNGFINGQNTGPTTFAVGAGARATAPASGTTGMARFAAVGTPSPEDWDAVLSELEGYTQSGLSSGEGQQVQAPNPDPTRIDSPSTGIDFASVVAIIDIVIKMFQKFRERWNTSETGEGEEQQQQTRSTQSGQQGQQGVSQGQQARGTTQQGRSTEQTAQNPNARAKTVENPDARNQQSAK